MSGYGASSIGHCPSWMELVRAAEEDHSLAQHLRECSRCREKSELLATVSAVAAQGVPVVAAEECPEVEDWAALADGAVGRGARVQLVEHLAGCESCAGLWRLLVGVADLDESKWEVREPRTVPRLVVSTGEGSSWGGARSRGLGQAAAVVLALLSLAVLLAAPFPPVGSGNGGRWRGPVSQFSVEFHAGVGTDPPILRWEAIPGATSYRVRLWGRDGEQVGVHHLPAEPSPEYPIDLSEHSLDQLAVWQVDALDAGRIVASTGPTEVRWPAP